MDDLTSNFGIKNKTGILYPKQIKTTFTNITHDTNQNPIYYTSDKIIKTDPIFTTNNNNNNNNN
jgi:hypothetical protein